MKKCFLPLAFLYCSFGLFSQTAGTLTVTYSTKTITSQTLYVYAIYLTNSSGALVNTLAYKTSNGNSSASADLTTWWNLIGKTITTTSTKYIGATDGISGATTSTWLTGQKVYWGRTASVGTVADGTYTVQFLIAEASSGGNSKQGNISYTGTFVKGPSASNSTVTASTAFFNLSLAWAPVNTAVNDVEMDKYYSLYPNPAISSIYVSGLDVKQVVICSLSGKTILESNEQRVNISSIPKGNYLAMIYTKDGIVVKKFQKI